MEKSGSPSASKSEETRARIARAALTLFVERGVAETRTRDIAEAAGVAEGSIYRYFESKESLAHLLFESAYVHYAEALTTITTIQRPFAETWGAVVAYLCRAFDDDAESFRFLLISHHQHVGDIPASLASPIEVLRDLMAQAYGRKEIAVADPDFAAALGLGAVLQTATFVLYGQVTGPLSVWSDEIIARSLAALRAPSS
jgi:AcrR family transcriptional regulator